MTAVINHARQQLGSGALALGMVLRQARTVDIAVIAKACGFDFLSIDFEHGSFDIDNAAQILMAALPVGITPLVRVPAKEFHLASRLLDAGAMGVIVAHVETAEDARQMVAHCKFPPAGQRSVALSPQLSFRTLPVGDAAGTVNAQTLIVVMLETPAAIANAAAIAAVPGVDVLLIGTNDLCAELGIPGQFADPKLEECYRQVTAACARHGAYAGMAGLHEPKLVEKFVGLGVRFIVGGVDVNFLMSAARERTGFLRSLTPAGKQ